MAGYGFWQHCPGAWLAFDCVRCLVCRGSSGCVPSTSLWSCLALQPFWLTTCRALRPAVPCRLKTSPARARPAARRVRQRNSRSASVLLQEIVDFGARRRAHQPAKSRAFDRRCGAGKTHGIHEVAGFHQPEGKSTVEDVSRAQRVDCLHLECRHVADLAVVEPIDTTIAVGDRKKAAEMLSKLFQGSGKVVDPRAAAQRFG